MLNLFSPILFISYSRENRAFAENLAGSLKESGFRTFLDNSDIDPGDNFVAKLSKELRRSTAILPVISEEYSRSRWAQAELYQALTNNKLAIPILLGKGRISDLDDPLERMLRDIQYVVITGDLSSEATIVPLLARLSVARRRYKIDLLKKSFPFLFGAFLLVFSLWWAVDSLNYIKQTQTRKDTINKIQQTSEVLQQDRVVTLASKIAGDNVAIGEIIYLSQDPSQSDISRFNSILLGSELRKGQEEYRWYVDNLSVARVKLENIHFVKTTFFDGRWDGVESVDTVFANVVWSQDEGFSMVGGKFDNTLFLGSEFNDISIIVTEFKNSKFIGSRVDTTNFSKVKFSTERPEIEGNPVITPYYALFDRSVVISDRLPPEEGILDLTMPGDDVVFDDVLFIDTQFEGWFRPEWFRNSTFQNCKFPNSLNKASLEKAGNIVQ